MSAIDPRALIESWFRATPNPHYVEQPLWVLVMDAFLVGSQSAYAICRQYGQDPDRKVPGLGCDDDICGACRSWRCPACESLSHVPDGSAPKCDHCDKAWNDE